MHSQWMNGPKYRRTANWTTLEREWNCDLSLGSIQCHLSCRNRTQDSNLLRPTWNKKEKKRKDYFCEVVVTVFSHIGHCTSIEIYSSILLISSYLTNLPPPTLQVISSSVLCNVELPASVTSCLMLLSHSHVPSQEPCWHFNIENRIQDFISKDFAVFCIICHICCNQEKSHFCDIVLHSPSF